MKLKEKAKLFTITLTKGEVNQLLSVLEPLEGSDDTTDALITELKLQTIWKNDKY
jgi:hypothetical protein